MSSVRSLTSALSSPPVTAAFRFALRGRLRVLAYHDIRSSSAFYEHAAHVAARYRPVSAHEIRAAQAGRRLPERAVWLTFDDASPDVVELGMPILDEFGISATMFVCPGVVDTDDPYWWEVVDTAIEHGVHRDVAGDVPDPAFRAGLKRVPDGQRRSVVAELEQRLEGTGARSPARPQITADQLRTWTQAGHEIGNHSWDHPLLDMCAPQEQRRQVADAHHRLEELLPGHRIDFFAFPNGNVADAAQDELTALGYQAPLLFDHGSARLPADRISRLRLDAFAPRSRMKAVVSGAHHTVFQAQRAMRRHG